MSEYAAQKGGINFLGSLIDHNETYGGHVIERMIKDIGKVDLGVDIGAGEGRDLSLIKRLHPNARTVAIEAALHTETQLKEMGHEVVLMDLERDPFPFQDGSVDLIIANQVIEHTKEVFWIFHEIARSLRIGGHFIMGVPNVLSFHNRIGGLAGIHPTQHKLASAHVRPFSKKDTANFLKVGSADSLSVKSFGGSQFYPFPQKISRRLASMFPNAAFSIFFDIVKTGEYQRQFLDFPSTNMLETSFYTGPLSSSHWIAAK